MGALCPVTSLHLVLVPGGITNGFNLSFRSSGPSFTWDQTLKCSGIVLSSSKSLAIAKMGADPFRNSCIIPP